MIATAVAVLGALIIFVILRDSFETIILPQIVNRRGYRPARTFYDITWSIWAWIGSRIRSPREREVALGVFGPFSILMLFAFWALSLILGFAMMQYGLGLKLEDPHGHTGFGSALYMSGTTFFTLGLGDVTPVSFVSRMLTMLEAGTGFGFLAGIIAYLPVIYQAFSRRELGISLLDARAGSPPTAEVLLRLEGSDPDSFERLLREWERWAAELMETHLSYRPLAFYRSQHPNQSWLAALTTILDTSAFAMVSCDGRVAHQASLTFAMARHAAVDLSQVFRERPRPLGEERLAPAALQRMRAQLARAGVSVRSDDDADAELARLRAMYEPYINSLARRFRFTIPAWSTETDPIHNWRTSAWEKAAARGDDVELHEDAPDLK